jgi:hypothetical protein
MVVEGLALGEVPRPFEDLDEAAEGDDFRVAVERVATADAAVRADHAAVVEGLQDLRHHRQRQVVELRDLARGRHPSRVAGQVNDGEKAVVGESGDLQHAGSFLKTAKPYHTGTVFTTT